MTAARTIRRLRVVPDRCNVIRFEPYSDAVIATTAKAGAFGAVLFGAALGVGCVFVWLMFAG